MKALGRWMNKLNAFISFHAQQAIEYGTCPLETSLVFFLDGSMDTGCTQARGNIDDVFLMRKQAQMLSVEQIRKRLVRRILAYQSLQMFQTL
jgi:hypothetical protein